VIILALDLGKKRIGMALGNTELSTVIPLDYIPHRTRTEDFNHVKKIVAEYNVEKILIGHPLNMNGSPSEMSRWAANFSRCLRKYLDLEVELVDERLSTFEARQVLAQIPNGLRRSGDKIDAAAAAVFLRDYMEARG
jgi:putative Holliday junction resolvase